MARTDQTNNALTLAIASVCVGENATLFIVRWADGNYSAGLALTVAVCGLVALVVAVRAFARLVD